MDLKVVNLNYTNLSQILYTELLLSFSLHVHARTHTHMYVWKEENVYFLDKIQYFPG